MNFAELLEDIAEVQYKIDYLRKHNISYSRAYLNELCKERKELIKQYLQLKET